MMYMWHIVAGQPFKLVLLDSIKSDCHLTADDKVV